MGMLSSWWNARSPAFSRSCHLVREHQALARGTKKTRGNAPIGELRDRHGNSADFGVELEAGRWVSRRQELRGKYAHLDLHLSERQLAVRDHKVLDDWRRTIQLSLARNA